jgi:hypothetical protein
MGALGCTRKSGCGVPLENVDPVLMETAVSMPLASMSNISFPSSRQRGSVPPPTDTCHFPAPPGNVVA